MILVHRVCSVGFEEIWKVCFAHMLYESQAKRILGLKEVTLMRESNSVAAPGILDVHIRL